MSIFFATGNGGETLLEGVDFCGCLYHMQSCMARYMDINRRWVDGFCQEIKNGYKRYFTSLSPSCIAGS